MNMEIIKNQEDYEEALEITEKLMEADPDPNSVKGKLLNILVAIIQDYENSPLKPMKTKLIELNNKKGSLLRGIFVPKNKESVALMIGGFESPATTKKKFKVLADNLSISSFRLDYTGIGLSDGDFSTLTIENLVSDIKSTIEVLNKKGFSKIFAVCHSLSACAISLIPDCFHRIILFAPALNQKELLRYWFVDSLEKEIDWNSYKSHLNEKEFLKDCLRKNRMTKANFISPKYFMENKDKDYSDLLSHHQEKILHIHGLNDKTVPISSNNITFKHNIFIKAGDHHLERPDMVKEWLERTLTFVNEDFTRP